ncbi:MAG: hypothetical protein OEO23_03285 [Gemmatimonadota bacterium]|nr:hypothetical protein [Gemmatimonadota bacterium]
MSESDRRAFLKKLAKTSVYSAPVIRTLAAPDPAAGQALSKKGGKGKEMNTGEGAMKGWNMTGFPVVDYGMDPFGMGRM